MPNYDYACAKCGNTFEVFQSMNDPRLESCPDTACGGPVRRLLGTGAGFIFKGAGFYATDYRSNSYKDGAKKDSGSASSAATSAPAAGSSCCKGGTCSAH